MKTWFPLMAAVVLMAFAAGPCFALMGIALVSKESAKEMGVEVRTQPNGPNDVWVEMEFKPEGKLKDFVHVSMEIRDGDKLLVGYAPLKEKRSDNGAVTVHFMADRAFLDKITLRIVAGPPMDRTGFDLRLKDFVEKP